MAQRIIVYSLPIAAHKRAHQQQECRFGLMEIGNQLVHDAETVTGFDHDLRSGMQGILPRRIHPVQYRLERLAYSYPPYRKGVLLVWLKLTNL